MKPRVVLEPLTGIQWVATSAGSALLSWLPVAVAMAALALGFVLGRLSWGVW